MANSQNSNRGFGAMDPEKQRNIAAEGGRAAHAAGTAHEFNSQEAKQAGSKSHGGQQQQQQQQQKQQQQQQQNNAGQQQGGGTRGGSSEQHARAGSQSHKNR